MQPTSRVRQLPSSYIREILKAATSPDCISLAGGLPSEALFPYDAIAAIFSEVAADPQAHKALFQYGLTTGYPPLTDFLKSHCELATNTGLLITNGSQQGIDLVARGYLDEGDTVVMEAPSYLGAIQAFALTPARMAGVAQQADGPDLEQLEAMFKKGKCRLFYAVPDFHNPSGCCWSLAVRQKVAELCRNYQVLLVEDAPYRELRFRGEEVPMVSSFCPEHAIVLRSFSKTTMPGLRLGMLSGPDALVQPLVKIKQAVDLHSNTPAQFLLLKLMLSNGYERHQYALKTAYAKRCATMCELLDQRFTEFGHYIPVEGGMFIWFQLRHHNADVLARQALTRGVAVVPSSVFHFDGGEQAVQALRLNYSHATEQQIAVALTRLADCLESAT